MSAATAPPPVPYAAAPIETLRARYAALLRREPFAMTAILAGGPRPGQDPGCVFDFEDGLRLIVSRECDRPGAPARLHVSASVEDRDDTPAARAIRAAIREAAAGGRDPREAGYAALTRRAGDDFRAIADRELPRYLGRSHNGIPHWSER